LRAKCSGWDRFRELFSGNISSSGLFIATPVVAEEGEVITIQLTAPDGGDLELVGRVTHVIRDESRGQKGLGIHLEGVTAEACPRYLELVRAAAEHCTVRPATDEMIPIDVEEEGPAGPPPIPPPRATGSAVQRGALPQAAPRPATRAMPPPLPKNVRPVKRAVVPVVGIDFGTSRSSVAAVLRGEVVVLQNAGGSREIPSLVGVLANGSVVVGADAQRLRAVEPDSVVASPKRLLGRYHDDPEIQPYLAGLAVPTLAGQGGEVLLQIRGRTFSVAQLCAPLLYSLRKQAEEQLKQEVTRAVLTVPVSFDEGRNGALRQAARMAGLQQVDIIDEPTAAAFAQNFNRTFRKLVAVYDFGGGTFDFSVVDAATSDLQVVATAGDTWLGGDDLDAAVAQTAANAFWRQHDIELRHQVVQWQRLLMAAERAKRDLSSREQTVVEVSRAALTTAGPLDLRHPVTRPEFDEMVAPTIQRSLDTCAEALELSTLAPSDLEAIYLSGGTSHVPAVRAAVTQFFGKTPRVAVPPERAVVIGAAMYCARLYNEQILVT